MIRVYNFILLLYIAVVCTGILGITAVEKWESTGKFLNIITQVVSHEKNN